MKKVIVVFGLFSLLSLICGCVSHYTNSRGQECDDYTMQSKYLLAGDSNRFLTQVDTVCSQQQNDRANLPEQEA